MNDFHHQHISVLQKQVVEYVPTSARSMIDGTVGDGGHARAILTSHPRMKTLFAIDRDPDAIDRARRTLEKLPHRIVYYIGSYESIPDMLKKEGESGVDAILLDLGFSTPQIDTPERGFSFEDGPLDMRYDRRSGRTAADILNTFPDEDIENLLREYGDERQAKAIARAIGEYRKHQKFSRTKELVECVLSVYRAKLNSTKEIPWIGGAHPATRTFQALRIAVNDELGSITRALPLCLKALNPGGRLLVITFHSGEEKTVKQFFKHERRDCICPPELPTCVCNHKASLRVITSKGIRADEQEQLTNPRSRSATLRVAEKI
jgi:16S rRNA (cytosine1402-N4)-methyltransferase